MVHLQGGVSLSTGGYRERVRGGVKGTRVSAWLMKRVLRDYVASSGRVKGNAQATEAVL